MADCWSCSRSNCGSRWAAGDEEAEEEDEAGHVSEVEMPDHGSGAGVVFVVDDSPLLAADSLGGSGMIKNNSNNAAGRWYKSVCSILHNNRAGDRDQQRKNAWNGVVESLMQRHPGSQLPERLISTIRRHFESLPLSYAQAGMDSDQVFLHIRLIDQAARNSNLISIAIQQQNTGRMSNVGSESSSIAGESPAFWDEDDEDAQEFTVAFAALGMLPISKQSISWAFKRAGIWVRQIQIFERKALCLGMVSVMCDRDSMQLDRMRSAVQSAAKKSRLRRLTLGLYGSGGDNHQSFSNGRSNHQCSSMPLDRRLSE